MGDPDNPTQKTVLIVDDDADIREMTERTLKRHGYEVITAQDGEDALSVLSRQIPDIILTDVLMPHMDGYQFFKELKNRSGTQHIPVLVITGRGQMEETFHAVGVDGFISKPFSPQSLIEKVESLLTLSQPLNTESQTPGTVLCVAGPEHHTILNQMTFILKNMPLTVSAAPSAAQAVSLAMTQLPTWVFTDIALPDKRIDEFVYILKHIPHMKHVKIFGFCYYELSALEDSAQRRKILQYEQDGQDFLKAGGEEYFGRFTESGFLDIVKTLIAQGGAHG